MTAEQLAAFRAYVAALVRQVLRPMGDAAIPEILQARAAYGLRGDDPAVTRLNKAVHRRAIAELQRRGFRPSEHRARAVAREYVREHIAWGQGDQLETFVGGGHGTYAFMVVNGRGACGIHGTWEERPGFILVHELYLQPCCFHFPIAELRAEVTGNRVVQLSLAIAV